MLQSRRVSWADGQRPKKSRDFTRDTAKSALASTAGLFGAILAVSLLQGDHRGLANLVSHAQAHIP